MGFNVREFIEKYAPSSMRHFKVSYVGAFAVFVWLYSITQRVSGPWGGPSTAVVVYLAMSVAMISLVLKGYFGKKSSLDAVFDIPHAVLGAVSSVFLTASSLAGFDVWIVPALLVGLSAAWLFARWFEFYAKLDLKNAIACIFGSMAVAAVFKVAIIALPDQALFILQAALPVASLLMTRHALDNQPEVEIKSVVYEEDGPSSIVPWKIMAGTALYSFVIGAIQGMPSASGGVPPFSTSLVLHALEAFVAIFLLWWVFGRKGLLRFSSLWRFILLITASGLFFLPALSDYAATWALLFVYLAQTLIIMLFWTMLADIAHHTRIPSGVVFGSGWTVYCIAYALGIVGGTVLGEDSSVSSFAYSAMAYVIAIASVFALSETDFSQRRIFADLDAPVPERRQYKSIEDNCERVGATHSLTGREIEVMQLICKGRSKNYIAENLGISENTVRSHSQHIYQKLGIHSKQELLDMVWGNDVLPDESVTH